MRLSRESPDNPDILKALRPMTQQDYAYCDMQGNIFMAAVDLGYGISDFSGVFMNSQLAGVIDHSFSVTNGMESDEISNLLQVPVLVKSPETIVAVTMWLDEIASKMTEGESASMAIARAASEGIQDSEEESTLPEETEAGPEEPPDFEELSGEYEYAYWLGYIYRCECLLHVESSRMVYGAFPESFMRKTYEQMIRPAGAYDIDESAPEICRRLDMLLVGRLWKDEPKKSGTKKQPDPGIKKNGNNIHTESVQETEYKEDS